MEGRNRRAELTTPERAPAEAELDDRQAIADPKIPIITVRISDRVFKAFKARRPPQNAKRAEEQRLRALLGPPGASRLNKTKLSRMRSNAVCTS
jgi:hypothetical protein